ncbi:hypothetical protein FE278_19805 [Salmonella enterica subsp. salamae serovar 3,10:b:e,n,x]|nr:hypothetical protein [Salmonella enterica subsp. salamae serovar 3,10:b:e,n,x]
MAKTGAVADNNGRCRHSFRWSGHSVLEPADAQALNVGGSLIVPGMMSAPL